MTPAASALNELFESWQRRRLAEVRQLLEQGVAPAELAEAMDPPAMPAVAAYYVAAVRREPPGRGDAHLSTPRVGHGGNRPAPAAHLVSAPRLLSPCETGV